MASALRKSDSGNANGKLVVLLDDFFASRHQEPTTPRLTVVPGSASSTGRGASVSLVDEAASRLHLLAEQLEAAHRKVDTLQGDLDRANADLAEAGARESELRDMLIASEQSANDAKADFQALKEIVIERLASLS